MAQKSKGQGTCRALWVYEQNRNALPLTSLLCTGVAVPLRRGAQSRQRGIMTEAFLGGMLSASATPRRIPFECQSISSLDLQRSPRVD